MGVGRDSRVIDLEAFKLPLRMDQKGANLFEAI